MSFSKTLPGLGAITGLAVLVHGYHLGVDDSAIYVPAIKRVADPDLYPFGAEFFMSHAHLSIFANLVGGSARLSHLPIDVVIFAWHVVSIFLLLLAAWQLLGSCFESSYARWSGVAVSGGHSKCPGYRHGARHHGPVPYGAIALHSGDAFRGCLLFIGQATVRSGVAGIDRGRASANVRLRLVVHRRAWS